MVIVICLDESVDGKDAISLMYTRPSLIKKRRQTKQARFVIMDTIAHVGFIIAILCLIYIYQDYSIYRTYQAHHGMFFKPFHKWVSANATLEFDLSWPYLRWFLPENRLLAICKV